MNGRRKLFSNATVIINSSIQPDIAGSLRGNLQKKCRKLLNKKKLAAVHLNLLKRMSVSYL